MLHAHMNRKLAYQKKKKKKRNPSVKRFYTILRITMRSLAGINNQKKAQEKHTCTIFKKIKENKMISP